MKGFVYFINRAFSRWTINKINDWILDSNSQSITVRGITGAVYTFNKDEFDPKFLKKRSEVILRMREKKRKVEENKKKKVEENKKKRAEENKKRHKIEKENEKIIEPTRKLFTILVKKLLSKKQTNEIKQIIKTLRHLRDGEEIDTFWLRPTMTMLLSEYPDLDLDKLHRFCVPSLTDPWTI